MARVVKPNLYVNYVRKAEELWETAEYALAQKQAFNAAVVNAIHCAINALDALTVFNLGKRSAGAHGDVLSLVKGTLPPAEFHELSRQLTALLDIKNAAEYQPNLVSRKDAHDAVARAGRILTRVKAKLPTHSPG